MIEEGPRNIPTKELNFSPFIVCDNTRRKILSAVLSSSIRKIFSHVPARAPNDIVKCHR